MAMVVAVAMAVATPGFGHGHGYSQGEGCGHGNGTNMPGLFLHSVAPRSISKARVVTVLVSAVAGT